MPRKKEIEAIRKLLKTKGDEGVLTAEIGELLRLKGGPSDVIDLLVGEWMREIPGTMRRSDGRWLIVEQNGVMDTVEIPPVSDGKPVESAKVNNDINSCDEEAEGADFFVGAVALWAVPYSSNPGTAAAVSVAGGELSCNCINLLEPHSSGEPGRFRFSMEVMEELTDRIEGNVVLCAGPLHMRILGNTYRAAGLPQPEPAAVVDLSDVVELCLDPPQKPASFEELVELLSPGEICPEKPEDRARLLLDLAMDLSSLMTERGIETPGDFEKLFRETRGSCFTFENTEFDRDFTSSLPDDPGIYRMWDKSGGLLYVGKARRLRERISSYFSGPVIDDSRLGRIRGSVHRLEVELTGNELEALLEEARAIRMEKPMLNIQRNIFPDKGHPHIRREVAVYDSPLVIFLPSRRENRMEAFGINKEKGYIRVRLRTFGKISEKAAGNLWRVVGPASGKIETPVFEREMEIILRWLEHNLDSLACIPVPALPGRNRLAEVINSYLASGGSGAAGGEVLI